MYQIVKKTNRTKVLTEVCNLLTDTINFSFETPSRIAGLNTYRNIDAREKLFLTKFFAKQFIKSNNIKDAEVVLH